MPPQSSTPNQFCEICGKPLGKKQTRFCSRVCQGTKHGAAKRGSCSAEYKIWVSMRQRCSNPRSQVYANYVGRGIKVCERWLEFENFISDMGQRPSSKYSLDRIDNNGNYDPNNCRWATAIEQHRNKRVNRIITIHDTSAPLIEWSEKVNIPAHIISHRIHAGWSDLDAVLTPVIKLQRLITFNNRTQSVTAWARERSMSPGLIFNRLKLNWSVEKTLSQPVQTKHRK